MDCGPLRYRMFCKEIDYDYCIIASSNPMAKVECNGRALVLSLIGNYVKGGFALKLLKRYLDPHKCRTLLKIWYESNSTACQVSLINKFFSCRKLNEMDEYLVYMNKAIDLLEEVDIPLLDKIIVYYILKYLPHEYGIIKQINLKERKLSSNLKLKSRLLNEKMAIKIDRSR